MNANVSIQQLKNLRKEFWDYLRTLHPEWNENTISTRISDAFFAFNNNIGVDFWASLVSEESMIEAREKIRNHFAYEKKYENPEGRADYYFSSLRLLKSFLDEKKPMLAKDWSGKAVSDINMKTAFQSWMHSQKKSNGEPYSTNTITAYTSALKNATAKLNLVDEVNSELFYYITFEEFEAAHKIILAAPNFDEVDIAAGNRSFSNGMTLYARFLQEMGEPSCWIFQGNPKYYDVVGAVESLNTITWAVNQYTKQIKQGDRAYIWLSGSEGGIIASGIIQGDPEMRRPDYNDPFTRGEPLKDKAYLAVDIELKRKLAKAIVPRSVLLVDERTKLLEILTFPGATNFRVTKAQEEVIESIINGNYERVPAVITTAVEDTEKKRYWLYSPGENARLWEEFSRDGIMGIGWDELGDLSKYTTKDEIKTAMKKIWGEDKTYKNDGYAVWQFANEINPGDVVFAKQGLNVVIGRGIVESVYMFDVDRSEYKHIRKVLWQYKGKWDHPGQAAMKTLTDITPYNDYVQKLESLFASEATDVETNEIEIKYPSYTQEDFIREVYLSEERYRALRGLLLRKKNIILQGAPGVGKTYAAQRLAFSILGEKDTSRVKVVQFHQSYSYEDFVMGYRPEGNGFCITKGPFYKFCKEAEMDDRDYFFIIDEINRGNLSKIFGELLMLIENDKRGEKNSIRLLYSDEQFFVPENVYIIGMMNTADRSLALIDYALRRRFAFFEMEPAFKSEGFSTYQTTIQNSKFDALIETVERLNLTIAEDASLGPSFRIGHSYFCILDNVDDAWLSEVVEYELLPLLNEYWFDEPSKVEQWSNALRGSIRG